MELPVLIDAAHLVLIQKVNALVGLHEAVYHISVDNHFAANFQDGGFPQPTNWRMVFLPMPVSAAASSTIRSILLFPTPWQAGDFRNLFCPAEPDCKTPRGALIVV